MLKQTAAILLLWALTLGASACGTAPEIISEASGSEETNAQSGDTVLTAAADSHSQQTLFLWEEGNAPAVTEYTENNRNYFDEPDFLPKGPLRCFPLQMYKKPQAAAFGCATGSNKEAL